MGIKYKVRAKVDVDKDGKKVFGNIGRVVETDKGLLMKLDVIPIGWEGFAYLMEPLPEDRA